jgi:hypothetical protein
MDRFDLEEFYDLIDNDGVEMKYFQASLCSCIADNQGQPDVNCDCSNGFRYFMRPTTVTLLRTNVNFKSLPERIGLQLQGGCQVTVPDKVRNLDKRGKAIYNDNPIFHTVNVGDVFVIENRTRRDRDILVKDVRDTVRAFDVQSIISVMKKGTMYQEGVDFRFDTYFYPDPYWKVPIRDNDADLHKGDHYLGGEVIWLDGGNAPAQGEHYTVEYTSKIQYVVFQDLAKDRGGDDDVLPKRLLCSLRQFVNFDKNPLDQVELNS